MKKLNFLKSALKYPLLVGTCFPSQESLIKKIIGQISRDSRVIIELGAGEAEITSRIIRSTSENTKVIAIEMIRRLYEGGKGRLKTEARLL